MSKLKEIDRDKYKDYDIYSYSIFHDEDLGDYIEEQWLGPIEDTYWNKYDRRIVESVYNRYKERDILRINDKFKQIIITEDEAN